MKDDSLAALLQAAMTLAEEEAKPKTDPSRQYEAARADWIRVGLAYGKRNLLNKPSAPEAVVVESAKDFLERTKDTPCPGCTIPGVIYHDPSKHEVKGET